MNTLRNKSIVAVLVAMIIFIVYLPSLQNGFVNWDDGEYVYENSFIQKIDGKLIRSAFAEFNAGNWHPLTWISHAIDYALWGTNPLGHHLSSNILHAINTMLVVVLVAGLLRVLNVESRTGSKGALAAERGALIGGAVTGLLFGLHPLRVESVVWISERKDVLCALFFLLSLLAYMRYAKIADDGEKHASRFHSRHYIFSITSFMLALLSKPMAVTLPIVLLILDWYPFERIRSQKTFKNAVSEKLPFFVLSLLASTITILAQKAGNAIAPLEAIPLLTRVIVGANSLFSYLRMMIAPVDLLPLYPYPEDSSILSVRFLLPILFVLGMTAACFVIAKRQKVWCAVWLYYVITLIPVIGIIQVGRQSMADRYTYIPSIGPFLLAGIGASLVYGKAIAMERRGMTLKLFGVGVASVLILLLSYGTFRQIQIWRSSMDLWNYAIAKEPDRAAIAYNNRALVFSETGQYEKALVDLDKAIAIVQEPYGEYNNRGRIYFGKGLVDTAIADFSKAISINPNYDKAYYNRGFAYTEKSQYDKAIEDFNKAVALNPRFDRAYNYRGVAFYKKGLFNRAIEDFDTALALRMNYAEAYNYRGLAYANKGLLDKAIEDFSKAIAINSNYYQAYSNRGAIYGKRSLFEEAIKDFKRAIEIDSTFVEAYNNLNYALNLCGPRCQGR